MNVQKNCPCLDEAAVREIIHNICVEHNYDESLFKNEIGKAMIGWFSRSIAASIFVFSHCEDGELCVLASERGKDAADFNGYWNCPCGYLDFSETAKECAIRECLEETGIKIPTSVVSFFGYNDDPIDSNKQNVTFRFIAKIDKKDSNFSKKLNEGEEVGEIKWIRLKDINEYQWAFGHDKIIISASKLIL